MTHQTDLPREVQLRAVQAIACPFCRSGRGATCLGPGSERLSIKHAHVARVKAMGAA